VAPVNKPHAFRNLWLGVLIVALVVGYFALRQGGSSNNKTITTVPTPTVVGVQDLCSQYYDMTIQSDDQQWTDAVAWSHFRALAQAGAPFDTVIANDIQAITNATTGADVSAKSLLVYRRCAALGYPPNADQRRHVISGATSSIPAP